jgi:hypothetical protein
MGAGTSGEARRDAFIPGPVVWCHGVVVGFRANWAGVLTEIDSAFVPGSRASERREPDLAYSLECDKMRGLYAVSIGSQELIRTPDLNRLLKFLKLHVQHAIAESAVERLFVHAGAVAWRGKAILLPGHSGSGKSILVRELICAGAVYLSDEFAVLDPDGLVHPFARPLSLRTNLGKIDCPVGELGVRTATDRLPVGMVAFTKYKPQGTFRPVRLTPGVAVLELLKHFVAVRANPAKAMRIARAVTSDCLVVSFVRGEARSSAALLLNRLDEFASFCEKRKKENSNVPAGQGNRTDY